MYFFKGIIIKLLLNLFPHIELCLHTMHDTICPLSLSAISVNLAQPAAALQSQIAQVSPSPQQKAVRLCFVCLSLPK